ncbi:tail protein X [Rahnella victoriana]|uniref:tail protein X n=1 Tax=Rahnella victoriana TaxID=1510570 RepID=UPI001039B7A9|nr:tail protein X [Rahnella victoriana]TBX35528.1 phage tail protein [Rahnella victoriana]
MKVYVEQGDTLDSLCWRYYNRTAVVVEKVYAANKGIADLGPLLPHGTAVEMPDIAEQPVQETLKLWD